jgi:hypothetical protein
MSGASKRQPGSLVAAAVALALIGVGTLVALPAPAQAATLTGPSGQWQLTTNIPGGAPPITLDLTKVALRGPDFMALLQKDDGTYADVTSTLPAEQDYLGTVEGHPDAAVAATVMSDGTVRGEVVFDRGFTWWFTGNTVTGTRGSASVTYAWPIRHAMGTDLIGSTVEAYEFGDDIDSSMYAALGNDPTKAIDMAELSMNNMRLPYMQSLGLMPQLGTVVLRGSATKDPYAGLSASASAYLGAVRTEWNINHSPHPEAQVQVVSNRFGGGVAWIGSVFGSNGYGAIGASPTAQDGWAVVARHEASHNWGPYDENGGDPEGPTIQSGNGFARYDSTEVYAVALNRANNLKNGHLVAGSFTATNIPPYAATDYLQAVAHGAGVSFNPLTNDHSPNGSALHLVSVASTSALGASVTSSNGVVTYHPLASATSSVDTFTYVLADAHGLTATGVVMVKNVMPFSTYPMEAATATGADIYNKGVETGAQADWLYTGAGKNITWTINQPVERDVTLTFQTRAWNGDQAAVSIDGGAPVTFTVPKAVEDFESEGQVDTPATVTVHLTAGTHTLVYTALNTGHFVDGLQTSWSDSAPTVPSTAPSYSAVAGRAFTVDATAGVGDADLPHDTLTYALQSGPAWLQVSPAGSLTGTPPAAGTYPATIAVTDASGVVTTRTVSLTVTKVATRVAISATHPYSMGSRTYYPVRVYVKTACVPTGYVYLTVSGVPAVAGTYKVAANSTTGTVVAVALSRRTGILHISASYAGSETCAAAPPYSFDPTILN